MLERKSENAFNETSIVSQHASQLVDARANTGRVTCLLMGLIRALRLLLLAPAWFHDHVPWHPAVLLLLLETTASIHR